MESTTVHFDRLTDSEIEAYIATGSHDCAWQPYKNRVHGMCCAATGEPFGKAGAYGIQGPAGCWVKHIEGEASCHVTPSASV